MIIDQRKFEIAEKLPPGEEILKRCSNFSAIIDHLRVPLHNCILFFSHSSKRQEERRRGGEEERRRGERIPAGGRGFPLVLVGYNCKF